MHDPTAALSGSKRTAMPSRPEVPALTGLRFIAAFSVAIAHGSETILKLGPASRVTYWVPTLAALGMGLFFVLSGFVIHYNYRIAVTRGGLAGLSGFVWARFARLYPLYFFIVLLELLLGQQLGQFMVGRDVGFLDVLRALPYYLTFTQSWIYASFGERSLIYATTGNAAVTWSISTEWFFYLCYPLVALLVIRARRPVVIIIAALAWCVVWTEFVTLVFRHTDLIDTWATAHYGPTAAVDTGWQDSFFRWLMSFSPYLRIGEFILGCLTAQLYVALQDKPPGTRERLVGRALLALGVLSVPVMLYLMYASGPRFLFFKQLNLNFGMAPSVALIIFCAARYNTFFSRVLNTRPFVALGEASYSIYLTHLLIFMIAASVFGAALPATAPNVAFLAAKFLFILALIMLISLGFYSFIEVPARQWLRGLWQERQMPLKRIVAYSVFAGPAMAAAALVLFATPTDSTASVVGGLRVLSATPTDSTASVVGGLRVLSATYGASCHAPVGNATRALSIKCNGKDSCEYVVDVNVLGDPALGCAKDFTVEYECVPAGARLTKDLPGEAGWGSRLSLSCTPAAADAKASAPAKE